jgi:capsule polysaccharide export protein KpsC/LpsZ
LRDCAAVYTINSGVGFEALFYLKPVFTFGAVDYQSATFNIKNIGDIGDNFFPELSDEKQLYIKKFISFYMRSKSININSRSNINRFVDAVVLRYLNHHLERVLR